MAKWVNTAVAGENLRDLLDGVYRRGDEVVVESNGEPIGVIVPFAQYERIEGLRTNALAVLREHWATIPSVEDVEAAEEGIIHETEAVRYGAR